VKGREVRPTQLEKVMNDLLQSFFPGDWVYVGNGKVTVEGFIPDFVHKEEKWIIEVNGDYWHSLPENKKRDKVKTKVYAENGYKVLEIWETEVYSRPKSVVDKVLSFFYGGVRDGHRSRKVLA
jgi:very-short-patch-repair endonuclease